MNKLSHYFHRDRIASFADDMQTEVPAAEDHSGPPGENLADVGTRMGEENEALRNLLVDAEHKIARLNDAMQAFGKIVAPINKTLRSLEHEKSRTMGLSTVLDETRAAYEALQTECYEVERKAASLERDNERLREEVELAQQTGRTLETTRAELASELSAKRAEAAGLQRELAQETAQRQALAEENRTFAEQTGTANKRILQLEGELATAREKLLLLEDENRSLHASCEQSVSEASRLSRQLSEREMLLTNTQTRLAQAETNVAEINVERSKLTHALAEANERQRTESSTLNTRIAALQSRAATAEKLLAEARQNLSSLTEEVRSFDGKAVEATIARNTAEKKLAQLEAALAGRDQQMKDIEQSRAALVERSNALAKTLRTRETALARAEEKIQLLSDRIGQLEADLAVNRSSVEKRVEELNTTLQRERIERAVVEGALEGARKEHARLQREMASLYARRRSAAFEEPAEPAAASNAAPEGRGVTTVKPII
jgi:crescentin